ncbi:hypothetical protein [Actinoallomurus acaciae]|uniref:Uncharacterized protein n=1 Tax=Actinoallomurus acaciae TaxID=502577 RepID=A0ABV5Y8T2_9ACTN
MRTRLRVRAECRPTATSCGHHRHDEILRLTTDHELRRLPAINGRTFIAVVAQADVARALPDPQVGDLLQALSTD